jgi:hypothetical protein
MLARKDCLVNLINCAALVLVTLFGLVTLYNLSSQSTFHSNTIVTMVIQTHPNKIVATTIGNPGAALDTLPHLPMSINI